MGRRLTRDFLSGLLFALVGIFALIYGRGYALGTLNRMGPGYFPLIVSCGLVGAGVVLMLRDLGGASGRVARFEWRPLLSILSGTAGFGLLIERGGLLLAGAVLILGATLAGESRRLPETLILATVLLAGATLLFSTLLGLPLRILPF